MYFPQSEKQTNNINCQDISDNGSDVRNARTPTEAFRFPRGPAWAFGCVQKEHFSN